MPKTQEVIDYLKDNPSFFLENQELLGQLDFGGVNGATPFYERQLEVLKQRESQQQNKIDLIVHSAKNNQRLETDLLDMAVRLLSLEQIRRDSLDLVSGLVMRQFNVKDAVFMLNTKNGDIRHEKYDEVRQRVAHKSSVCDDRVSTSLMESVFGEQPGDIGSCAFVPLVFEDKIIGVMVMGSTDSTRFEPGIGVVYLDRLGLLLGGYFQSLK